MIISTEAEKSSVNIQQWFIFKTLEELVIEENFFNIIKAEYEKPNANIIVNGEKLQHFLWEQGEKKDIDAHHFYSTWNSSQNNQAGEEV